MITTDKCVSCKYATIDDSNKAKIIVMCAARDKKYIYGQRVPCDDYEKKENE